MNKACPYKVRYASYLFVSVTLNTFRFHPWSTLLVWLALILLSLSTGIPCFKMGGEQLLSSRFEMSLLHPFLLSLSDRFGEQEATTRQPCLGVVAVAGLSFDAADGEPKEPTAATWTGRQGKGNHRRLRHDAYPAQKRGPSFLFPFPK